MELLHYTEEHKQFRKRLRKFCQSEIIPNVQKWENDGIVPKSVWKKMGQAGFLCTAISPDYGGRGGDFLYSVIALEEVTRTNHYGLDAFLHSDIVAQTSMAKYWNTEMANRIADRCLNLCGEFAMMESCPIARTFRDVRVTTIFAGTNEIMKGIVAKSLGL